jgi:hypothetical protein
MEELGIRDGKIVVHFEAPNTMEGVKSLVTFISKIISFILEN